MPKSPNFRLEKGFIDPLSLIGVAFLIVTIAVGTAVTNKTDISLSLNKMASAIEDVGMTITGKSYSTKSTPVPTPVSSNPSTLNTQIGKTSTKDTNGKTSSGTSNSNATSTSGKTSPSTSSSTQTSEASSCTCIGGIYTGSGCGSLIDKKCSSSGTDTTSATNTSNPGKQESTSTTETETKTSGNTSNSNTTPSTRTCSVGKCSEGSCKISSASVPYSESCPVSECYSNSGCKTNTTSQTSPSSCTCVSGIYTGSGCGSLIDKKCSSSGTDTTSATNTSSSDKQESTSTTETETKTSGNTSNSNTTPSARTCSVGRCSEGSCKISSASVPYSESCPVSECYSDSGCKTSTTNQTSPSSCTCIGGIYTGSGCGSLIDKKCGNSPSPSPSPTNTKKTTPYCFDYLHSDCINGCIPDIDGGKCRTYECTKGQTKCESVQDNQSYKYTCDLQGKYQKTDTCEFGCDGNNCKTLKYTDVWDGSKNHCEGNYLVYINSNRTGYDKTLCEGECTSVDPKGQTITPHCTTQTAETVYQTADSIIAITGITLAGYTGYTAIQSSYNYLNTYINNSLNQELSWANNAWAPEAVNKNAMNTINRSVTNVSIADYLLLNRTESVQDIANKEMANYMNKVFESKGYGSDVFKIDPYVGKINTVNANSNLTESQPVNKFVADIVDSSTFTNLTPGCIGPQCIKFGSVPTISDIKMNPSSTFTGLGGQTVKLYEQAAIQQGFDTVVITNVNPQAINFWKWNGYVIPASEISKSQPYFMYKSLVP